MLRLLDQIGAPIRGHRRKSHPATIPRTLLFTTVRRRVDNSLTCPDGSPESAEIRFKHVRNVEVGGSSPLTSTSIFPGRRLADLHLALSRHPACATRARSPPLPTPPLVAQRLPHTLSPRALRTCITAIQRSALVPRGGEDLRMPATLVT